MPILTTAETPPIAYTAPEVRHTDHTFTKEEAIAWAKAARPARFCVSVTADFSDGTRSHSTYVDLSRKDALAFVGRIFSRPPSLADSSDDRRIPCSEYRIGSFVTYWIG